MWARKWALTSVANPGDMSTDPRGTTKLNRSTETCEASRIALSGGFFTAETRYGVISTNVIPYASAVSTPTPKRRPRSCPAEITAIRNAITPKNAAVAKTSVEKRKRPVNDRVINTTKVSRPSDPSSRRITRYTAIGTGKISTRLTWPWSWPAMYSE